MKNMRLKKILSVLLVLLLAFSVVACGDTSKTKAGDDENTSFNNVQLLMGTGGTSGTWYPVGGAICSSMNKVSGINVNVQASAGGVENIRTVANGERDLGMALYSLGNYALKGEEAFKGEKLDNIRGIAVMMPMAAQFLVRADSGITCIKDLKGKKVGVGAPGSGEEVCVREFLTANGMSYDDCDAKFISFTEQVTAFKDRQLDAIFIITTPPTSGILDAAAQADVALIPIAGEERDNILKQYSSYYATKIPADAYDFLSGDVETVGMGTLLFCSADLDENVVYAITKAMYDDADYLKTVHPALESLSAEYSIESMGDFPMHPGAEKYYKEIGLIK
ncbi:TAXI family TRAP transporter solute-binding subunit [Sinanaerobacter chloroacetimidivorans]|uniref:TAXI family TRAP transporter solute-binding subunit n=1 Tax=Sinanaerobacter chloroacetimidivorans TaxID=2818044 RepID=A0A8J8B3S7_9FIRM|nr:TAXI family TRAP transporter solute-binding subunit [Sinanaerobacter chloroacetimidivorans]MBR0600086.1 TAXI family TRAP transporter solute-binding subunit [Sinanaerobacter chloroacetimidivorans]